eukprot:SAG11_NODE_110_length_16199_cov_18.081180_6_plen_131_part_00
MAVAAAVAVAVSGGQRAGRGMDRAGHGCHASCQQPQLAQCVGRHDAAKGTYAEHHISLDLEPAAHEGGLWLHLALCIATVQRQESAVTALVGDDTRRSSWVLVDAHTCKPKKVSVLYRDCEVGPFLRLQT